MEAVEAPAGRAPGGASARSRESGCPATRRAAVSSPSTGEGTTAPRAGKAGAADRRRRGKHPRRSGTLMSICPPTTPLDPSRRDTARNKRIQAADIAYNRVHPCHVNNCEERDYPYVANYSKGLVHDGNGDVDYASYQSLLNAVATRNPADFEAIQLGG